MSVSSFLFIYSGFLPSIALADGYSPICIHGSHEILLWLMVDPPWLPQVTGVSTESGPRLSRLPIE